MVKTVTIDGVQVSCVTKATLEEVSILKGSPAVDMTYARVVDLDKCSTLEADYPVIQLTARYVMMHRKVQARENGDVVSYKHTTSPYDRAANNFENALRRLM
jgi:hypothetical protein